MQGQEENGMIVVCLTQYHKNNHSFLGLLLMLGHVVQACETDQVLDLHVGILGGPLALLHEA